MLGTTSEFEVENNCLVTDEERAVISQGTLDYELGTTALISLQEIEESISRRSQDKPTDEERIAAKLAILRTERRAYESILDKFERSPSIEDSLIICWQPLGVVERMRKNDVSRDEIAAIRENQKSYLLRLPEILEKMETEPDGYILDREAAIFVHLSVGIVLLSRLVEQQQTERQWEWIDDALRVINMPKTESSTPFHEQTRFPRTIPLSYKMAKALIWSMSASRLFADYKYEEALRCYCEVVSLFSDANERIFDWLEYGDTLSAEALHYELIPDDDGIGSNLLEDEHGDIDVVKFPLDLFHLENAVKAFDALIDEGSRDTNWTQVAEHCRFFAKNWHLLSIPVESKHIPEQETVSESWAIAHGIVLNMMSNDDRIKELRREKDYQIEDRLRLYFFHEAWDSLPVKARAALISADREYESPRGRRQGVFEDLWLVAREILVETLVKSYNAFSAAQKEQREIKSFAALALALDDDKDLNDIVQDLYYAPLFEDYLRQTFNEDDKEFIKGLEKRFRNLNRLRNDTVHANRPAYKKNNFERDIRETYAEFLGIGRNGILPRLMRLRSMTDVNSPKRTSQPF